MSIDERALAYVLALPPSVAGSRGHDSAFRVASCLVWGFDLDQGRALSVMSEWNRQRANPQWSESELRHKIESAAAASSSRGRGWLLGEDRKKAAKPDSGVAPEPRGPDRPRIPAYDPEKAERLAAGCRRPITLDRLAQCSPVPVPAPGDQGATTAEAFLNQLYRPGERILVFTDFKSQGDYLWIAGSPGSGFRLARRRGVAPVPSRLPAGGEKGIWFLVQPVSGDWTIQPGGDASRYGRRHGACVKSWRYLLLENDVAPESVWLRCLVQLPMPLVALYTSGGRSLHALVKIDADSKPEYDVCRDVIRSFLPILGADPAATTGVRLSRLPGCRRGDRLQRLVWLDPASTGLIPILDRVTL